MSKVKTILSQVSPMFKKYTHLGMVSGNVVKSRYIFHKLPSGLDSILGYEMDAMTELHQDNRKTAHDRMIEEADKLGATHVINVRYQMNSVSLIGLEIFAFGDAIKLDIEPTNQKEPTKKPTKREKRSTKEPEGGGPWGGAKIVPPFGLM
jgi:uncharacterized protein YbjQ (UPF0145 family)